MQGNIFIIDLPYYLIACMILPPQNAENKKSKSKNNQSQLFGKFAFGKKFFSVFSVFAVFAIPRAIFFGWHKFNFNN
jgi:hypothetical protein